MQSHVLFTLFTHHVRITYFPSDNCNVSVLVHDGGLEDNVGDSGEESEDEWNYIKGEEANKENISPSQPDCEVNIFFY